MSTELRDKVVEEALKYVGVHEDPPHSDKTMFGEWAEENGGENGVAWCANFCSFILDKCSDGEFILCSGYHHDKGLFSKGCDHVPTVYRWALKTHRFKKTPTKGDLILVDTGINNSPTHIGIVTKVIDDDTVETVEGNYSDKVCKLTRSITDDGSEMVFGFVSID